MRNVFQAILGNIIELDLSYCKLYGLEKAGWEEVFQTIPENVIKLNLRSNRLWAFREKLAPSLVALHKNIRYWDLSLNKMYKLGADGLAELVAKIPSHVYYLDLSENKLNRLGGSGLAKIVAAIPPHATVVSIAKPNNITRALVAAPDKNIRYLNLAWNNVLELGADGLAELVAKIPSHINYLDLSSNDLYRLGAGGLAKVLAAIPTHVTAVYIGGNNLSFLDPRELATAVKNLHPEVDYLDLSGNGIHSVFNEKTHHSPLSLVFAALPAALKTLSIRGNDFSVYFTINSSNYLPLKKHDKYFQVQCYADMFKNLPENLTTLEVLLEDFNKHSNIIISEIFKYFPEHVKMRGFNYLERAKKGREELQQRKNEALLELVKKFDATIRGLKVILDDGADINCQTTDSGYTPLMLAIDAQNERIAEFLLKEGANPNLKNAAGKQAIDLVSRSSPLYEVLTQGEKDARLAALPPINKQNLLLLEQVSSLGAKTKLIRECLDAGADINCQDEKSYTPLMLAVDAENERVVEYLLRAGAIASVKNKNGETARDLTSRNSPLHLLLKRYELLEATVNSDLPKIKLLLKNDNMIIDSQGAGGYTALLIAVGQNKPEIVEYLLEQGASLEITNDEDQSVFDLVSDERIKQALLQRVNSVEEQPSVGETAGSDIGNNVHSFFGKLEDKSEGIKEAPNEINQKTF